MQATASVRLAEVVSRYQLVEADKLPELTRLAESTPDVRLLAREMAERGWLTVFQINQVLQGKIADLFLGPFVVLDRLGEGGMGMVFKARHKVMHRLVALKVIRPEKLANPDAVKRFQREIQAAAKLNHPNIVTAFDADHSGHVHFLVMEYVEGFDLARRVQQNGPLPVATACDYISQAALGLQHAHEQRMVHRDIKPHNLLVTPKGVVKILDMGLARLTLTEGTKSGATSMTQEGAVLGTPDYIAPEQALDTHTADIRSDIYSLGCTFYFLLAGRPPFVGTSLTEVLVKHQLQEAEPIEKLRPDVPPKVSTVIRKMIAKSPTDRFQFPREVAKSLAGGTEPEADIARPSASRAPLAAESATFQGDVTEPLLPRHAARKVGLVKKTGSFAWRQFRKLPLKVQMGVAAVAALVLVLGVLYLLPNKGSQPQASNGPSTQPGSSPPSGSDYKSGPPVSPAALVVQPSLPPGVRSWSLETRGHRRQVEAVAYSPNGQMLASSGDDGAIRLWGAGSGQLLRILLGHADGVRGLCWSPDSKTVASASFDMTVRLWEADTGRLVRTLKGHTSGVRAVAWSPDGKTIAGGGMDGVILLWEPGGRIRETVRGHFNQVQALTFSSNSKTLASCSIDTTARLWNAESGKPIHRLTGTVDNLAGIALSPDGNRFAATGAWDKVVHIYDTTSGKELPGIPHPSPVYSVAWSPDGKTIAAGYYDATVRLYHADTMRMLAECRGHTHYVIALSWSPDSKTVASGSVDCSVRVWNAPGGEAQRTTPGHPGALVSALAWSADGKVLASGAEDGLVQTWDPSRRDEPARALPGHGGAVNGLSWSPKQASLASASGDGTIRTWEGNSSQPKYILRGHSNWVLCVAWSPDGRLLYSGGNDKTVRVWKPNQEQPVHTFPEFPGEVWGVSCSSDDKLLSFAIDGRIQFFEAGTRALSQNLEHPNRPWEVAWSPDGKHLASAGGDGRARIWTPGKNEPERILEGGGREMRRVAWSPDGKILAAAGWDRKVRLWNASTGQPLRVLDGHVSATYNFVGAAGHAQAVGGLAWSADGKEIALSCDDTSIRVFDAQSGQVRSVLCRLKNQGGLIVSADGHYHGSAGLECELVYVVQTEQGQDTFTTDEFARKYGWKNDPSRVRLSGK